MLVRRAAVEQIGRLDEQYFLFNEELDWCFDARRAGWSVRGRARRGRVAPPRAEQQQHRDGSLSISLLVETRLRYYRKNHSMLTALMAATVLGAGFVKQRRRDPAAGAKLEGIARWWRSIRGRSEPVATSGARAG